MKSVFYNIIILLFLFLSVACNHESDRSMIAYYFTGVYETGNKIKWQYLKQCYENNEIDDSTSIDTYVYNDLLAELNKGTMATTHDDSIYFTPGLCIKIESRLIYLDTQHNTCTIESGHDTTFCKLTNRCCYQIKYISGFYRYLSDEYLEKDPGVKEFGYTDNTSAFASKLNYMNEPIDKSATKVLIQMNDNKYE